VYIFMDRNRPLTCHAQPFYERDRNTSCRQTAANKDMDASRGKAHLPKTQQQMPQHWLPWVSRLHMCTQGVAWEGMQLTHIVQLTWGVSVHWSTADGDVRLHAACTAHASARVPAKHKKHLADEWEWHGMTDAPAARTAAEAAAEAAAARDISPMAGGTGLGLGLGLGLGSAAGMTGAIALGGGDVNTAGTGSMGAGGSGLSSAGDGVGGGSSTVCR